MRELRR